MNALTVILALHREFNSASSDLHVVFDAILNSAIRYRSAIMSSHASRRYRARINSSLSASTTTSQSDKGGNSPIQHREDLGRCGSRHDGYLKLRNMN